MLESNSAFTVMKPVWLDTLRNLAESTADRSLAKATLPFLIKGVSFRQPHSSATATDRGILKNIYATIQHVLSKRTFCEGVLVLIDTTNTF